MMIVNVMLNIIIIGFLKYYLGNFFYNQHPNFLFFLGTLAPKLYISISPMIDFFYFLFFIFIFKIGQNRLLPPNHPPLDNYFAKTRDDVEADLLTIDILPSYTHWFRHGEERHFQTCDSLDSDDESAQSSSDH